MLWRKTLSQTFFNKNLRRNGRTNEYEIGTVDELQMAYKFSFLLVFWPIPNSIAFQIGRRTTFTGVKSLAYIFECIPRMRFTNFIRVNRQKYELKSAGQAKTNFSRYNVQNLIPNIPLLNINVWLTKLSDNITLIRFSTVII